MKAIDRALIRSNLLLVIGVFSLMALGCSNASPPQKATANGPANASANQAANSNLTSPPNTTIAGPGSLVDPNAEPAENGIVAFASMKDAVRARLIRDAKEKLSDEDWKTAAWLDTNLGVYYKNDDDVVKSEVCDVVERVLKAAHRKLKPWARQRLYDNLSSSTKCKTAVALAYSATADSVSTQKIP